MKNTCIQCLADSSEAFVEGFIHHFRLRQNGSVILLLNQQAYDFDDLVVSCVKPCLVCAKSTYFISTSDGIKGLAVEFWES